MHHRLLSPLTFCLHQWSRQAGAASGFSVDLLFYPIDTIKTRLQSAQGFVRAGGFKGVYKGVGSVGVGSAPGAAAFFTGYEGLKKVLGQGGQENVFVRNPGLCHMVSASGGELVSPWIREKLAQQQL